MPAQSKTPRRAGLYSGEIDPLPGIAAPEPGTPALMVLTWPISAGTPNLDLTWPSRPVASEADHQQDIVDLLIVEMLPYRVRVRQG